MSTSYISGSILIKLCEQRRQFEVFLFWRFMLPPSTLTRWDVWFELEARVEIRHYPSGPFYTFCFESWLFNSLIQSEMVNKLKNPWESVKKLRLEPMSGLMSCFQLNNLRKCTWLEKTATQDLLQKPSRFIFTPELCWTTTRFFHIFSNHFFSSSCFSRLKYISN